MKMGIIGSGDLLPHLQGALLILNMPIVALAAQHPVARLGFVAPWTTVGRSHNPTILTVSSGHNNLTLVKVAQVFNYFKFREVWEATVREVWEATV